MKQRLLIIVIVVLLLVIGGVIYLNQHKTVNDQLVTISGTSMGTSYHIKLALSARQKIDLPALKQQISSRLADIDGKMSTYKTGSEVSRFNRHASHSWMPITAETLFVINAGLELSQLSEGAFDITVGKLVNLWGFGPTLNSDVIPDADVIQTLLSQVGYHKLEIRQAPPALRKNSTEVYLDLSAIAKGYAVDAIASLLLEKQIGNFMVEIGGEIITRGSKQRQQPWVIGIESPTTGERSIRKKLHLHDVAMATSGDYRNYFEDNGTRYSHTIDPVTGYPIKHQLASVTVIDSSCMRADALATAIMVMGPTKGLEFAKQHQLAIFMLVKQNTYFIEQHSPAFEPYLKSEGN